MVAWTQSLEHYKLGFKAFSANAKAKCQMLIPISLGQCSETAMNLQAEHAGKKEDMDTRLWCLLGFLTWVVLALKQLLDLSTHS